MGGNNIVSKNGSGRKKQNKKSRQGPVNEVSISEGYESEYGYNKAQIIKRREVEKGVLREVHDGDPCEG